MVQLTALIRLVHPLPTALNAVVAAALTSLAGGTASQAALAALTMLGVHGSIGALNDIVDRGDDAGRPEKPLATGAAGSRSARTIVVLGASVGFGAAGLLGPAALGFALAGAALGYLYDLWLKRTPAALLPFAIGVALLPPFAWSAAAVPLPGVILLLSIAAVPGGGALALQNALADIERDTVAGSGSLAVRLGAARTLAVAGVLHLVAWSLAGSVTAVPGAQVAGGTLMAVGLLLGSSSSPARRRRGWEASALGLFACALGVAAG